jgi:DNA-binding NtrC family response regulator
MRRPRAPRRLSARHSDRQLPLFPPSQSQQTTTPYVLLVDDDPATLLALAEALRLRLNTIRIDTAGSVDAALPLMQASAYDVVIADIIMPGRDGFNLLGSIKDAWPSVPVLLMTAGSLDCEETALLRGAYAFLSKPIDVNRLVRVIQAASGKPGALAHREASRDAGDRRRDTTLEVIRGGVRHYERSFDQKTKNPWPPMLGWPPGSRKMPKL